MVTVFDYGGFVDAGRPLSYVVMELVDGRPLADMLTAGALRWRLAVLIGAQVGAALAAAHGAGIVHRDVKPANVMVTTTGVKLVDFGISAAVGELDGRDGELLGTAAYLAPERVSGAPVRPATDVYALGLLLYRSLSGRTPGERPSSTEVAEVLGEIAGLPPSTLLRTAASPTVAPPARGIRRSRRACHAPASPKCDPLGALRSPMPMS